MNIKLEKSKDFFYRGILKYAVVYDHSAGLPNRYSVFILNVDDPFTIGRELPLSSAKNLINDYEVEAKQFFKDSYWAGEGGIILRSLCKRVMKKRVMKNRAL